MKAAWIVSFKFLSLGLLLALGWHLISTPSSSLHQSPAATPFSEEPSLPEPTLHYESYPLDHSVIHVLRIPRQGRFSVTVAVSPELKSLEDFAQQSGAIAVLNAGFFDPQNHKTTSYVIQQSTQVADPRQNERLIYNPDLAPYLSQILDRSEFRRYTCAGTAQYDIALHSAPIPDGCELIDAVGAGPQLLPEITSEQEGFTTYANGVLIRDALGSYQRNARTAVGLTPEGDVVWVMVAQQPEAPTDSGMSFQELAAFMQSLGVTKALNLDGGSSSALYYEGRTFYGKVNAEGQAIQRPVKSVLLVQPQERL